MDAKTAPGAIKRRWVELIFGLICLAVAALPAVDLLTALRSHRQMQTWVERPATILRAELKDTGNDTHEARATYQYTYDGRAHVGDRVGLHRGDSGPYHPKIYANLSVHQSQGRPVPCFVNPADPSQSILYRELRWSFVAIETFAAQAFGAAGLWLLARGLAIFGQVRTLRRRSGEFPNQPWMWRTDWAQGEIVSSGRRFAAVALVLALALNFMSAPLWFLLPGEMAAGDGWAWLAAAIPLVSTLVAFGAFVAVLRAMRYGRSILHLAHVPATVGGQLAGVVRTSTKIHAPQGFRTRLRCLQMTLGTMGDRDTRSESTVWEDELTIARELLDDKADRTAIPIFFQIPAACAPTDAHDPQEATRWQLEVSAAVKGVDFLARFEVPVFKTDDAAAADLSTIAPYINADPDEELRQAGIAHVPIAGGHRFVFPPLRSVGTALIWSAVALFLAVETVVLISLGVVFVMPLVFGLLALLLALIVLDVLFFRSVVDVTPAGVSVRGGILWLGRPRILASDDIADINISVGSQSGRSTYYDIALVDHAGRRIIFAKQIRSQRLAERLVRQINEAAGRKAS